MLSHRENVQLRNSGEYRRKRSKLFSKICQGQKGFDLGQKKFKIISCLCTLNGIARAGHSSQESGDQALRRTQIYELIKKVKASETESEKKDQDRGVIADLATAIEKDRQVMIRNLL
jgi:hypothetical protein